MFTNTWFEITAKANFEKYIKPLADKGRILNFLEIGCYEGRASVWLMENTGSKLTVIDTFLGSKEHDSQFEKTLLARFRENIYPYKDRVEVLKGTSSDQLKSIKFSHLPMTELFDFIYVDGSHQASDVLEDAILAFPLLKENGIMIFDDFTWGQGMSPYDVPATGINAFLFVYANQLRTLEKNTQVIIRKTMTPEA